MNKAPDAFRTISEVADDLDLPQHVLRFWESRFPQIKPMKRGGGRRYYRPEDIDLLRGIRHLLYGEGYTIRGVQRILKEQGLRTVQSVGQGRPVLVARACARGCRDRRGRGSEQRPELPAADLLRRRPARCGTRRGRCCCRRNGARRMSPRRPRQPAPVAAAAASPAIAGLAPEDLDRLKTVLSRLEECRQLLDQAVGSAA